MAPAREVPNLQPFVVARPRGIARRPLTSHRRRWGWTMEVIGSFKARGRTGWWSLGLVALALAGCGGSGSGDSPPAAAPPVAPVSPPGGGGGSTPGAGAPPGATGLVTSVPPSRAEASRFLAQSTFGPRGTDIDGLMASSYGRWLDAELAKPRGARYCTLQNDIFGRLNRKRSDGVVVSGETDHLNSAFYTAAVRGDDQLRQRMVWAWSQIFVTSIATGPLALSPAGTYCEYVDLLGDHALGNFRTLLDHVARSWHMGIYLTHAGNSRENFEFDGQLPDQNFAREIMQLFTIGLRQLNDDGSLKLDGDGKPIPTYTKDDIVGLSKVFTGWTCVRGSSGECKPLMEAPVGWVEERHSCSEKKFLGTTIDAGKPPPPPENGWPRGRCNNPIGKAEADLKIALDTLFNHPNVGPFIGRQLIQRLVTSNPSPAYVARVTAAFNNNGSGVRGDLKAVLRAILLDPEARSGEQANSASWGKVREPLLRTVHLHRVFAQGVDNVVWTMSDVTNCDGTHGYAYRMGQHAFRAATVFNFYRPGFAPSGGKAEQAGLVAPEMQILNTAELAFWSNHVSNFFTAIDGGYKDDDNGRPRQVPYVGSEFCQRMNPVNYTADWLELARGAGSTAGAQLLVDRLALEFLAGRIRPDLRARIVDAVVKTTASTRLAKESVEKKRIQVASSLLLMSPGFLVQK